MFVVMLAMTSFTSNKQSFQLDTTTAFAQSQIKKIQTLSIVDITVEDVVFNEAENLEVDIEFDFSPKLCFQNRVVDFKEAARIELNKYNFLTRHKALPLYDLFCNWKLNLSS
jgi:hypothetical protein